MTYKEAKRIKDAVFLLDCLRVKSNYICVVELIDVVSDKENWQCHVCSRSDRPKAIYNAINLGRSIQEMNLKYKGIISSCNIGTKEPHKVACFTIW